jgi:hypothetical protein
MFNYIVAGEPYPAQPLEGQFPNVSGSASAPLLLCYDYRRILYINMGSGWAQLAQLSPNQVLQTLSPTLLSTVIAALQAQPINDPLCLRFAKLLTQGF